VKLGFGLYRHNVTPENLAFARQCGATHVVVHLVDYFRQADDNPRGDQPIGGRGGWGLAGDPDRLWTLDELLEIKALIEAHDLTWFAIENFDPGHWHDVLLDGPLRGAQIDKLRTVIRTVGAAGIPVIGYNFSLAGVAGRISGPFARGGAVGSGMSGVDQTPIPNGMVWNMTWDPGGRGDLEPVDRDVLWERYERFLGDVLPVAEEAGVVLAAHPDDPPVPVIRGQPRMLYESTGFRRLVGIDPSPSNKIDFCLGTVGEMADGGVYDAVDEQSRDGRIAYLHFRNIRGRVPEYRETFIDEGDTDMLRVIAILKRNAFDGVLIPDHAPQMSCDAPWHAGMAFAMGYMAAAIRAVDPV
jgi:mannonate dehydratase